MITNPINPPPPERRPWSIKLLALLIVIEAFAFIGSVWLTPTTPAALFYLALGPAAALTALLLWLLTRQAWALAILVQGITLAITLFEYTQQTQLTTYPLMAFAIFLVIYLHNPDVRVAFSPPTDGDEELQP